MDIRYFKEPKLVFGANRTAKDPRDGLLLYGPNERWGDKFSFNSYTISVGYIGPSNSQLLFKKFVQELKKPIISQKRTRRGELVSNETQRPSFPGFEAVFDIHWPEKPTISIEIEPIEIFSILDTERIRKIRTNKIVDLYLEQMVDASLGSDEKVDIWFVIVPKEIFKKCRPKSKGKDFNSETISFIEDEHQGTLFSEEEMFDSKVSEIYDTTADFHHLLKARANQERLDAPIQIIVEPKLEFKDIESNNKYSDDMRASLAWNLTTSLYYKLGKKPWKLADIRPGVCYLGLVFKKFQNTKSNFACSAAQLFLDDGDGTIFRGNNGLWLSDETNEFHLEEGEAYNLLDLALTDYFKKNQKEYPKELFIHGKVNFLSQEWEGFKSAVNKHDSSINLVGVIIQDKAPIKIFRDVEDEKSDYGIMRGIAAVINDKEAFLNTRGFVPRLNTSLSLEIPNLLYIKIARGEAQINTVLKDILALTKLNYNSCIYGDGKPVTLRFSDSIGSILTATPNWKKERRQFKYYI